MAARDGRGRPAPEAPLDWNTFIPADGQGTAGPRRPLAHDPGSGVYTEGSCTKGAGGENRLGAAVWREQSGEGKLWLVDPNGLGPTSTINRAELSAIHLALTRQEITRYEENVTIYTDSACSIQLINKMVYEPARMKQSKHRELLENIVTAIELRCAAGSLTTIQKVKSHAGIKGNEKPDQAAGDMSRGHPACEPNFEASTNKPYQKVAWPAKDMGENQSRTILIT